MFNLAWRPAILMCLFFSIDRLSFKHSFIFVVINCAQDRVIFEQSNRNSMFLKLFKTLNTFQMLMSKY